MIACAAPGVIPSTRNPTQVADDLGDAASPLPAEALRRKMSGYLASL